MQQERNRLTTLACFSFQMAEIKHPKSEGWRHAWVFDHSRCHAAMGDDVLDVKPGGKQHIMHDTIWQGRNQTFAFRDGTAKGMKKILLERGIDTTNMVADQMRELLAKHPDFRDEKNMTETMLVKEGHIPIFLHPELNPFD